MRHILYIINPISGKGEKKDIETLIEKKTSEKNIPFKIISSEKNGDYSSLVAIISTQKITDVVIAGGDGTVNQVIHALKDTGVRFGIIPCGSGNGLAFAAGIPKSPQKAIDLVFTGKAKRIDGFYINNRFSCMLSGLGFDAKVAHDFARRSKRGLATYISQVAKNFFTAKAYSFDISVNDSVFSIDAFFISIANSNQFGNHFTIAPKASLSDGLLDVVIAAKQNKFTLLIDTVRQIAGWNKLQETGFIDEKKGIIYFQTNKLLVKNNSLAPLHIDGEPVETSENITVEVEKNCFLLLQ